MTSLAIDLIEAYREELIKWRGELHAKVTAHLSKAEAAIKLMQPPVFARELDAALAEAERQAIVDASKQDPARRSQ